MSNGESTRWSFGVGQTCSLVQESFQLSFENFGPFLVQINEKNPKFYFPTLPRYLNNSLSLSIILSNSLSLSLSQNSKKSALVLLQNCGTKIYNQITSHNFNSNRFLGEISFYCLTFYFFSIQRLGGKSPGIHFRVNNNLRTKHLQRGIKRHKKSLPSFEMTNF